MNPARNSMRRLAAVTLLAAAFTSACTSMGGQAAPDYAGIIASPDRSDADRQTDVRRKQPQLLAFTGARPGMRVLDMGADAGYSTELLARTVAPSGVVYGQNSQEVLDTLIKDRFDVRMKKPAMANVVKVVRNFDAPVPAAESNLDMVTFFFAYHDLGYMNVDRASMNKALFNALKSGGHYIIADHSALPGADISVSKTLHRIDEARLKREVEAAGFKLVREENFMRNPEDTRDVPVFRSKVPVDEFVLDYVKP
jgi:predicted methyltransferase